MNRRSHFFSALLVVFTAQDAVSQGTANLSNLAAFVGEEVPFYDVDGVTPLSGSDFLAQLYAGPNDNNLLAWGVPVPFLDQGLAGYFAGSTAVAVGSVVPGGTAVVQVRFWEADGGATYEAARDNSRKHGESTELSLTLGGSGAPPSLPANLVGLQSAKLVPEPPPCALAAAGLLVALAWRGLERWRPRRDPPPARKVDA